MTDIECMESEITPKGQFNDPVTHMCLAGIVVASWSLKQELARWQVQALLL